MIRRKPQYIPGPEPLTRPIHSCIIPSHHIKKGECMSGSIHWEYPKKKAPYLYVKFYFQGVQYSFHWYRGERMYARPTAEKLLHQIQGEVERGVFNPLKYSRGATDMTKYLSDWLDECADNWTPGTKRLYESYIRNHINPFFEEHPYQVAEVRKKQLQELKTYMGKKGVKPEFAKKVVDCLRSALFYAFDCEIIAQPPARIKKSAYQIPERSIKVTTPETQAAILKAIDEAHRPIFEFLALHVKLRPANAFVLKWEDYDPDMDAFVIRRGLSNGQEVEYTKTKREHVQPVHPRFKSTLEALARLREFPFSPYVFTCKESRHKHKRYTKEIFQNRWRKACGEVGVKIDAYHGLRHTTITQYANTLTPEQTKILAGHTSAATTMKYYGRVHVETERALMEGKVTSLKEKRKAKSWNESGTSSGGKR